MINFKDFEDEIKSFDNKLNIEEQNLVIEYLKILDFNFLAKQEPISFVENLIINDTIIKKVDDSRYEEPDGTFLVKYKNLKLIQAF